MPEAWLELDTVLKERLRRVLDDPQRPVTEAELRKLSGLLSALEGRAREVRASWLLGAQSPRGRT